MLQSHDLTSFSPSWDVTGTTVSAAENAFVARRACLSFLHTKLGGVTKLDQEMLDALRVYDTSLLREPQWGDDFFGIDPFYISSGGNTFILD